MEVNIYELTEQRGSVCNKLLRSLPEWFGIEEAIQNYVRDVENMQTFVAEQSSGIVGFISLNKHNKLTAEIHVMAVDKKFHRHGFGKRLVSAAENNLKNQSFKYLTVKTLSPSRPNKEYDLTRKFYEAIGFEPLEEFKTLWDKHNPCLLMLKVLNN
ncbi:MAG TPA: GNAT family N-acetyltransferase [Bdellovibrionota bacterium]|nr:GNAT family N-acetyltransferase [Bdellovibrionota bacterium]